MQTYEQLTGAQGKKIYYRAERFPAGPLFGDLRPRVEIDGEEFDVQDVSMTGLALIAPLNRLLANQVGETVDYRIRAGGMVLHEGAARISRVHRRPKDVVIGLGLTTDYLDVARLVTRQQDVFVRQELQKFTQPSDNIDPAYKLVVADVLDIGPEVLAPDAGAVLAIEDVGADERVRFSRFAATGESVFDGVGDVVRVNSADTDTADGLWVDAEKAEWFFYEEI